MMALPVWALTLTLLQASSPEPSRVAVLVGNAEGSSGRRALRHTGRDVQSFADVLVQVGRFQSQDVHVLLEPNADEVLRKLDAVMSELTARPGETMLLFYYSGHADDVSLFTRGTPLALSEL